MSTAEPSAQQGSTRPETLEARRRILNAGIRSLIAHGVDGSTMGVIADDAKVSKALVHYHFADRATLFAEIAMRLARRIAKRELASLDAETPHVVDRLRERLQDELARGEIRALLELGMIHESQIAAAVEQAHQVRQNATTSVVKQVFERLALTPQLPPALIAETSLALANGLALQVHTPASAASFDAFWLAMFNLADQ